LRDYPNETHTKELLAWLAEMTPPGLEIMPLDWAYEDEDQTIAVRVEDGVGSHAIEDNLLGPMIDDDESHGTCFFAWYGPNTTMRTPGCNFRNYLGSWPILVKLGTITIVV